MDYSNSNPPRRVSRPNRRLAPVSRDSDGHLSAKQTALQRIRRRRRRRRIINIILILGITAAIILFFWAEQRRRSALNQLQAKETELADIAGGPRLSEEKADQIRREVGEHIALPDDPKPTVATIVDVENLRATSDFYNQAKNGDFLVITEKRAILYDPGQKKIIDVVSVKKMDESPSPAPTGAVQGEQTNPAPALPPANTSPSPTDSFPPAVSPTPLPTLPLQD